MKKNYTESRLKRQRHIEQKRASNTKMSIGMRARMRRKELGLDSKYVAKAAGMSPGAYSDLENQRQKTTTKLHKIAEVLNVRVKWLEEGVGTKEITHPAISISQPISSIETDPRYIRLPLYDVRAAMGDGEVVGDYIETLEHLPVSKEWIRENLRVPPEIVQLITARGDSMLPEFGRGDPVFIDPRIRHLQGEGVYVFSRYGEVQIKRLQKLMDGRLALLSRNPDYQTDHVLPEHINDLHIHARVLGAWGFKRY